MGGHPEERLAIRTDGGDFDLVVAPEILAYLRKVDAFDRETGNEPGHGFIHWYREAGPPNPLDRLGLQIPRQPEAIGPDPAFPADFLLVVDGVSQAGMVGQVPGPVHVVAAGRIGFAHVVADNHGTDPVLVFFIHVKEPHALRRQKPLVGTAGVEVAADFGQVQGNHPHGVGAVHHGHGPVGVGQAGQFRDGRDQAGREVHVAEDHNTGVLRDARRVGVHDVLRRGRRNGQRNVVQVQTVPLGQPRPQGPDGRIFLVAEQHVAAPLPDQALAGYVHAHRRVQHEGDPVRGRPHEPGQLLPGCLHQGPEQVSVPAVERIRLEFPHQVDDAFDDRPGGWTYRSALQVGHVVHQVELLTDLRPVGRFFGRYGMPGWGGHE